MREYLRHIVKSTNEAFNNCVTQFVAFGLRLLLELVALAAYVDIHHVYKNRLLSEKLDIIQGLSLGSTLSRSTFFRRALIKVFGPKDGRILVDSAKTLYSALSRHVHVPPISCLVSEKSHDSCACIEELEVLRDIAEEVLDLVKKIVYMWITMVKEL